MVAVILPSMQTCHPVLTAEQHDAATAMLDSRNRVKQVINTAVYWPEMTIRILF